MSTCRDSLVLATFLLLLLVPALFLTKQAWELIRGPD